MESDEDKLPDDIKQRLADIERKLDEVLEHLKKQRSSPVASLLGGILGGAAVTTLAKHGNVTITHEDALHAAAMHMYCRVCDKILFTWNQGVDGPSCPFCDGSPVEPVQ